MKLHARYRLPLPRLCAMLALSLAAVVSHAAQAPWPPAWGSKASAAQGERNPDYDDDQVKLGNETLYVGVSSLAGIRKTLGGRLRTRTPPGALDPSDTESWLCYTAIGDGRPLRLWFGGNSQHYNGPDMLADYVVETLPASARATSTCPRLPERFTPITLDHDVELGASAADLVARMPPLQHDGNDWIMATSYVQKHWLVTRVWVIHVVDGRIVGVRVHTMLST